MIKSFKNRKILALVLAASLTLIPVTARAGVADIITFLNTITNTLKDGVGQVLNGIESIHTRIRDFQQRVLWPLTLIDQTKRLIGQMRVQLGGLAGQIHSIETNSATLVNPSQLESLLRSRNAGAINQVQITFNRLYNTIPGANDAREPDRNVMDAADAVAVGSLKTAIVSDQASEQLLKVADGLEQQTVTAAPGSSPLLTVQAQVASLQSQAMLQRMLAAQLRQEATSLAQGNVFRKRSAAAVRNLHDQMDQILTRP